MGVMVLFNGGGDQAGNTDAVASHLNRLLSPFGVEIRRAHRLAVFPAQIKDLAYLDTAVGLQKTLLASWARITGHCQPEVRKDRWRKIPLLIDFDKMSVRFIGARHRSLHPLNRMVRNDSKFQTDGA